MPKISIIVPAYKVEKFLEKCLDSILSQTFADFELLLVDDGSPDRSGEICDAYAAKDSRIVVIHQENGGLSNARNTGIKNATGDYIGFVDADDYLEPQMYEILYRNITQYQADIAIVGYVERFDGYDKVKDYKKQKTTVLNQHDALWELLRCEKYTVFSCDKLFKRHLLEKYRFPEGKVYEDAIFSVCVFKEPGLRVVFDPVPLYIYVQRDGSIMNSGFSAKQMDYIEAWQINQAETLPNYPEFEEVLNWRLYNACFSVMDKLAALDRKYYHTEYCKKILEILKPERKKIFHNQYLTFKRKVLAFCILYFPTLYYFLIKAKRNHIQQ